ncbi:MAG: carbon starvation protein A [Kiritimatiellia bacterium]
MVWFLGGIAFLVLGYLTYGRLVERILGPDDRPTPALAQADGVDCVPLPKWKNLLIQLLNIAGVGPVIGVVLGIKFGKVALLIIPVGCVLMGGVHDFLAGMMSIRSRGANLPKLVADCLGRGYARVFSWIMIALLLLCVTVFINVPASIVDGTWLPQVSVFWWAVALVFAYYVAATLFPVDKIIGKIYPVFGALLVVGSLAMAVALVWAGVRQPSLLDDCAGFADFQARNPLFPCLFVTIACGIISGFHATQSPIVARTMRSEREARATFYGMMILEGVIAMVWAAGALAIYNLDGGLIARPPAYVLTRITTHFLGSWMGGTTVLAVVILAVTSGDTALRSARLSLGEMCGIDQVPAVSRVLTCLPLVLLVAVLLWWSNASAGSFGHLWNYFAWGNQAISATTLLCGTVWLVRQGKRAGALVAAVPAVFMTTVVVSFILWASADQGQPWGIVWKYAQGRLVNCGCPLWLAVSLGVAVALVLAAAPFVRHRCGGKESRP